MTPALLATLRRIAARHDRSIALVDGVPHLLTPYTLAGGYGVEFEAVRSVRELYALLGY